MIIRLKVRLKVGVKKELFCGFCIIYICVYILMRDVWFIKIDN